MGGAGNWIWKLSQQPGVGVGGVEGGGEGSGVRRKAFLRAGTAALLADERLPGSHPNPVQEGAAGLTVLGREKAFSGPL